MGSLSSLLISVIVLLSLFYSSANGAVLAGISYYDGECANNTITEINYSRCNVTTINIFEEGTVETTCYEHSVNECSTVPSFPPVCSSFPLGSCNASYSASLSVLPDFPVIDENFIVFVYFNDSECNTLSTVNGLQSPYCLAIGDHYVSKEYYCERGVPHERLCGSEICTICALGSPIKQTCQNPSQEFGGLIVSCGFNPKDYIN